ncbi:MAG: hypothetical protein M3Q10_06080 [Chloroflexota bacterium]|nr:hypothetical protein [Chloroflexota bacterium]
MCRQTIAVLSTGAALAALLSFPVGATAVLPQGEAEVPGPEECRVAPRSAESVLAMVDPRPTEPAAVDAPPPEAIEHREAPPTGAELATAEAIAAARVDPTPPPPPTLPARSPPAEGDLSEAVAVIRELVACDNAGDALRSMALLTDGELRKRLNRPVDGALRSEREIANLLGTSEPLDAADRASTPTIEGAVLLPDGRIAVMTASPYPPGSESAKEYTRTRYVLARVDGRWRIDDVEDFGPSPVPPGTPRP